MTTYIFENLLEDQEISFDPIADELEVQNPGVHAGFLLIDHNQTTAANTRFHMDGGPYGGKGIFLLDVQPQELVHDNFILGGGGRVLIGDNSHATANDHAANSHTGTAAGDFFMGMGGNDTLTGGGGDDLFSFFVNGAASSGVDVIDGGAGFDWIFLGNGESSVAATINLAAGTVTGYLPGSSATLTSIEAVIATDQNDSITGSGADNLLDGFSGSDTVRGGGGNDTLFGYEGNDLLDGETGTDTAVFEETSAGTNIDLDSGVAHEGGLYTSTLISIENAIGSDFNDQIAGTSGPNVLDGANDQDRLDGRGGNDTLIGSVGNDTLDGGAGTDSLVGGAGDDTYFVDSTLDQVIEAAGGGNDTVITSAAIALPGNVENIIFTGTASIIINGNAQNNVLGGGAGNDTLNGGAGTDTVSYALAATPVVVNLETNVATGQGTDSLSGFENATGGSASDTLIGNSGNNVLDGSAGADTMRGGFGNDTYVVDRLTDVVHETSNTPPGALLLPGEEGPGAAVVDGITDTVVAAINYTLGTFVENLTLSGTASRGTGNALANRLNGNAGNDTLSGADGNDTLNGGAGDDSLNGGAGNDTLIWSGPRDIYEGSSGAADSLRLSGGNLNLTAVNNARIKNVEQIDLRVSGNNVLTLNEGDVLDLSFSSNTVRVLGNAGDVVNALGFTDTAVVSGGFRRYESGAAVLLIDTDMTVNLTS